MNPSELLNVLGTDTGRRVLTSFAVLAAAYGVRWLLQRRISAETDLDLAIRLRWGAQARAVALLVAVLGLVFIWGSEVRDFLLSLVVLASALVVATKELIMCLTGSFARAASGGFAIGDRIEVAGHRGDVIDARLLTTTLLESGPAHQRTGRTIVLPNSVFLTQPVANETFTNAYVLHTFDVSLRADADWRTAAERLREVAEKVCAEHVEPAREHMRAVADVHGLPPFNTEPKVTIFLEGGRPSLRLRIPAPARQRGRMEQEVLEAFLLGDTPPA